MNREEFKQLYYLDKEIRALELEKEENETSADKCTQIIQHAPGGTSCPGNRLESGVVGTADLDETIVYILDRRKAEKAKLLNMIDSVEKTEIRMILYFRYVCGLSWETVARKLDTTEAAVKGKDKRFFEKLK